MPGSEQQGEQLEQGDQEAEAQDQERGGEGLVACGGAAREARDVYSYFLETDDVGIIRWLVRNTNTLTGILPTLIAEDVARGAVRTLRLETLNFPLPAVFATLAGRPLPPAAETLLAEILAEVAHQWRIAGKGAGRAPIPSRRNKRKA